MERRRLWVGLDVSEASTQICVLGADELPLFEGATGSSAVAILEELSRFEPDEIQAVAMETGAAHTLARHLKEAGCAVLLLDAGKVSRFLSISLHKTDGNDARGIAEIARIGRHSHLTAQIRGVECQQIRDQLVIRSQLIRQRTASRNALRSMLRNQGSQIRQITSGKAFRSRVEEEILTISSFVGSDAIAGIRSLLDLCEAQSNFIQQADKRLARLSDEIPVVQRFRTIPGVGPICAISFYSAIGDPDRFRHNASVGAYLGMVPRIKQSGVASWRSGISKAGDALTRGHLVMSAGVLISRAAGESALRDWGIGLTAKIGYKRARMAVARKLAIAMLSIWKSGSDFCAFPK